MQLLVQPLLGFLFIGGIIGLLVAVVTTAFWLWMLIECISNAALTGTEKIVWILVMLFTHFIGALLYFFLARGNNRATGAGI